MGSSVRRVHLDRGNGTSWCYCKGDLVLGGEAKANCELCFTQRETAPGPNQILYCSACDQKKPGTEFGSHRTRATGRMTECLGCYRSKRNAARKENRAETVALAKKYRHRNPEPSRRNARLAYETKPKAVYARETVRNEIKRGRMKRGACEVCGSDQRIHGHHDDYDRPLIVRWLCVVHHVEWHDANGPGANIEGEPVFVPRASERTG